MDLTCHCPTGTPNEKAVCSGRTGQVHPAEIIFKFQVFKKPTDITIDRPVFSSPITVYTAFDHHLPNDAIAVWVVVEKNV